MTDYLTITVLAADKAEAMVIAEALVDEKLAACANIIPGVTSVYRWQGKVEHADECMVQIKTRTSHFDAVTRRVKELHSYDCPCIVAEPITLGDAAYLQWIDRETAL